MREGGVDETERRSRAEATLSSRGQGNFSIQFSFFLSFCFSLNFKSGGLGKYSNFSSFSLCKRYMVSGGCLSILL